jgi:tetratricopeptide (TPR) repeat protein
MYIFFQVFGLSQEMKFQGMLRYVFSEGGDAFFAKTKKISEYNTDTNFIEEYSLENFSPGYYRIEISVLDKDGSQLLSETEDFEISPVVDMPRPLVVSKVMPASRLEEYTYSSGTQLLKKGNIKDAGVLLEKAYHKDPSQLKYGLGFAQVLFINGEYQRVKEILIPFLENQGERGEILYFLGKSSHALGQFEDALSYYKSYLSRLGTNLEILNLMGTCYYQLGNKEEALQIWQRSLEINPDQEQIKKLVKSLQEKKD